MIQIGQVWRHRTGPWVYVRNVHRKDCLAEVLYVDGRHTHIGTISFFNLGMGYMYDPVATEIKQTIAGLMEED